MTDKVYRVAAIGCGRKGTEHARAYNLNQRSVVVAGADPDPENLDIFTKRFGVPGYADYNEMLRKENVDIVLAVLPVIANREVVLDTVRHGVPAICTEKPLAARLSDADEMVAACRERGVKFGCGDLERNHHYYWEAKDRIAAGRGRRGAEHQLLPRERHAALRRRLPDIRPGSSLRRRCRGRPDNGVGRDRSLERVRPGRRGLHQVRQRRRGVPPPTATPAATASRCSAIAAGSPATT